MRGCDSCLGYRKTLPVRARAEYNAATVSSRRTYQSGSRWAFWRWADVDFEGETYLLRLNLVKTPWFSVMLHWIKRPDPHPDPHDHPVSFLSITVRGGYREWRPSGIRSQRVRYYAATDIHRIVHAKPKTLTLCFAGPGVRVWGFHTSNGFVPWKEYRNALRDD